MQHAVFNVQLLGEHKVKILGVTQVDLFMPILAFVFGAAEMSSPCAVISTRRLNPTHYERQDSPVASIREKSP